MAGRASGEPRCASIGTMEDESFSQDFYACDLIHTRSPWVLCVGYVVAMPVSQVVPAKEQMSARKKLIQTFQRI